MKTPSTTDRLSRLASYLVAAVLVAVPFHAFLTIWTASAVGHYTAVRLWSAVVLLVLLIIVAVMLLRDRALFRAAQRSPLWQLIALYAALSFVLGVASLVRGGVTPLALAYGLLSDLRYLAFFFVVAAVVYKQAWLRTHWRPLVLWPAAVVAGFALLQYWVLPLDFLSHFGYGKDTIQPISTINNNPEYPRVMSTLRGANPLGAYLVLIAGLLGALFVRNYHRARLVLLGAVGAGALLLSFSRSAWLGAVVTVGVLAVVTVQSRHSRRLLGFAAVGVVLLGLLGLYVSQHNAAVQNALYHTEDASSVSVSSNDSRESALRTGLRDVSHEPFGRGPGTAGPASVYNDGHPPRLAENYYLQLGQELGWVGLGLFIAVQTLVFSKLWQQRADPLALGLFAAGIGLVVINLLSHAWTDDTLSFLWWGLAGIALSTSVFERGPDAAA